jgi:hypothetical protein
MSIEQYRERVSARIRQAVQQTGIDVSALPADAQDRLINTIADNMLLEFDKILSDAEQAGGQAGAPAASNPSPAQPESSDADELILWEGRPFLSLGERYVLTNDRIRLFHGVIGRDVENIELIRLQDIDYHQGVSERIFGIGDIYLHSVDASDPIVTLRNVHDPEAITSAIRKAWLDARKRRGVVYRDIV